MDLPVTITAKDRDLVVAGGYDLVDGYCLDVTAPNGEFAFVFSRWEEMRRFADAVAAEVERLRPRHIVKGRGEKDGRTGCAQCSNC